MSDWVKEARARCEAATKPWRSMAAGNTHLSDGSLVAQAEVEGLERPFNPDWVGWEDQNNSYRTFCRAEDADFVAHARTDLPHALDVIEAADALAEAVMRWEAIFPALSTAEPGREAARNALRQFWKKRGL